MSDRNLRLQVILNAVDKITRPFKTMQASNKALAAAVKNSRDELKRLSAAGDQVNTFNSLQASIKKTADELAGAKLKAQMMTREMGALENPTKKQTKALEDQWRAVDRLEQRQRSEVAQMGRVRSELYRMGVSPARLTLRPLTLQSLAKPPCTSNHKPAAGGFFDPCLNQPHTNIEYCYYIQYLISNLVHWIYEYDRKKIEHRQVAVRVLSQREGRQAYP